MLTNKALQMNSLPEISDKDTKDLSTKHDGYLNNNEVTFSFFKSPIKNTTPYQHITLTDVVKAIKGVRAKAATEKLRASNNVDKAKEIKATHFDYVTFSGTFTQRKAQALIEYSGFIALDFDNVDVKEVKHTLLNQTEVDTVLLFTSPSGNGIKWIVPSTTRDEHEKVFRMYQRYCKAALDLEVDESGKDIARACFIPYDEEVVLNEAFQYRQLQKYWNNPQSKSSTNQPTQHTTETSTPQFEGLSPFDDYNSRANVVSLLESHGWCVDKHASNSKNIRLTRPGKRGGVSASLRRSDKLFFVFTDNSVFEPQKGYNPTQVFTLLNQGSLNTEAYSKAAKQLKDLGYGNQKALPSPFTDHTSSVKKGSKALNFYTDGFKIVASHLAKFVKHDGFMRISEPGNDTITIIKNENKILKPFNHKTDTLSYLKQQIAHPEKRDMLENQLVASRNVIQNSWELLEGEPYNLHRDKKDAIYLPFKNGVCKVTKEGIELVDYKNKEIAFFIDNLASQKHNLEMIDISKRGIGNFEKFLIYAIIGRDTDNITEIELRDIRAFYSMIGYLISNYKNPAESPAVILTDKDADDDKRKGGRGKSLITEAIRKVRGSKFRDGATFDSGYRHVFADLEKYHDIYILDDIKQGFNYNALYTNITGDITAERKGTHAVTIPFADAPKFVITTNWIVPYDKQADSTNRRFVEYKLSHFWNISNTPEKYFGERFFDDWDNAEWQLFFEFLIACVMQFLTTGLVRITYSKDKDNYKAFFSNDAVLHEFERIFSVMMKKEKFIVTNFLDEHYKNQLYRYGNKLFHTKNAKNHINTYIAAHKLDVKYVLRDKKWIVGSNMKKFSNKGDDNTTKNLLF